MAVLNYAEQYQQALQQKFSDALKFNALYSTPNNANIRWSNAKTVQIPTITTGGFVDVDRDSLGTATRRVDNSWAAKTLAHDREFRTLVDPMDVDETNMASSVANITRVFNDEHKIPELDKYAASKLYSEFTTFGGTADNTALDATNVLGVFDNFMEAMDEAEVPEEGRYLYVTPAVYKVLKRAQEIERHIRVDQNTQSINRNTRSLDDVTIVRVPSSRMKTAYNFTDGAVPATGADQINMIAVHPLTVITPQRYEFVSMDQPSATTGGKWLYYERLYWDLFAIEQKAAGIQFNTTVVA
ncbi:capsid protein [Salinithrix halophila]|uniref:Capsid protein n=1 Tax=Salinithrix halophila TaxID=1485204 RepID=A0ABV8J8M0_9BACL